MANAAKRMIFTWMTTVTDEGEATMLTTKRKPTTVGEILTEEFMRPMGLTQSALAEAMGVQRKHVNELCGDRRAVTAATALILGRVFGNSPDFWLNVQRRSDLWAVMNTPEQRERVERARPLRNAA
jgi:addiction module HigA family antidote